MPGVVSRTPLHNQEKEEKGFLFVLAAERLKEKGEGKVWRVFHSETVNRMFQDIILKPGRKVTDTECSLRCLAKVDDRLMKRGKGEGGGEENKEGDE